MVSSYLSSQATGIKAVAPVGPVEGRPTPALGQTHTYLQQAAPGPHCPLLSRWVLVAYSLSYKITVETLHKLNVQYILGR